MMPTSLPGVAGRAPKPPRSIGELVKRVRAYAKNQGTTERRTRDWISYMVLGAALERATGNGSDPCFSLKGGVVAELRLRGVARATEDLDTFYRGSTPAHVVQELDDVLAEPYGDFTFTRTEEPLEMKRANTLRMPIRVRYRGNDWGTISVDMSRGEPPGTDVERIEAFDLEQAFGLQGPRTLLCISLRHHMAQKLHGATRPETPDVPNERVQDVIDILLFREEFTTPETLAHLGVACESVFTQRATHTWPPTFQPPAAWRAAFAQMANEIGIPYAVIDEAIPEVRAFIDAIANR